MLTKDMQVKLVQSPATVPVHADEVILITPVKSMKDKKGKVRKEGHVVMVFVNVTTQQAVSKIEMSVNTAMNLRTTLERALERVNKELASKKMPEKRKESAESTQTYIG